jgi:exopolysaccharide biosynthesis protein
VTYSEAWISGEKPARAHVVRLDLGTPGLRLEVTPADTSKGMEYVARLTTGYLHERHAQVAINASYFLPFEGGSKGADDYYPHEGEPVSASGAVIAGGKTVSPVETTLDERVDAMLCFHKEEARIVDGQQCPSGFSDGVAAGPRLLDRGEARAMTLDYAIKPQPRTAFALSRDGRSAWIVTVDGRQPDSAGVGLPALAGYLRRLGASEAINLDGGGSTTLAVEGEDGAPRILNRTIHTGVVGRERPVANHVLVFAKPVKAAR